MTRCAILEESIGDRKHVATAVVEVTASLDDNAWLPVRISVCEKHLFVRAAAGKVRVLDREWFREYRAEQLREMNSVRATRNLPPLRSITVEDALT